MNSSYTWNYQDLDSPDVPPSSQALRVTKFECLTPTGKPFTDTDLDRRYAVPDGKKLCVVYGTSVNKGKQSVSAPGLSRLLVDSHERTYDTSDEDSAADAAAHWASKRAGWPADYNSELQPGERGKWLLTVFVPRTAKITRLPVYSDGDLQGQYPVTAEFTLDETVATTPDPSSTPPSTTASTPSSTINVQPSQVADTPIQAGSKVCSSGKSFDGPASDTVLQQEINKVPPARQPQFRADVMRYLYMNCPGIGEALEEQANGGD